MTHDEPRCPESGGPRQSQEDRRSHEKPGGARRSQEEPITHRKITKTAKHKNTLQHPNEKQATPPIRKQTMTPIQKHNKQQHLQQKRATSPRQKQSSSTHTNKQSTTPMICFVTAALVTIDDTKTKNTYHHTLTQTKTHNATQTKPRNNAQKIAYCRKPNAKNMARKNCARQTLLNIAYDTCAHLSPPSKRAQEMDIVQKARS